MKKISLMLIAALLCVHFTAMAQPKPAPKATKDIPHESGKLPPKQANRSRGSKWQNGISLHRSPPMHGSAASFLI